MHEQPTVLTPTEARGASPNKLNLRVLLVSMLMAIVVGSILYAVFFDRSDQSRPLINTEDKANPAVPTP